MPYLYVESSPEEYRQGFKSVIQTRKEVRPVTGYLGSRLRTVREEGVKASREECRWEHPSISWMG